MLNKTTGNRIGFSGTLKCDCREPITFMRVLFKKKIELQIEKKNGKNFNDYMMYVYGTVAVAQC